jgi:hypothetical protein
MLRIELVAFRVCIQKALADEAKQHRAGAHDRHLASAVEFGADEGLEIAEFATVALMRPGRDESRSGAAN